STLRYSSSVMRAGMGARSRRSASIREPHRERNRYGRRIDSAGFFGVTRMGDADTRTIRPVEAAANTEADERDLDRAKGIIAELADAARSVAESLVDEQRKRAAKQVAAVATAV